MTSPPNPDTDRGRGGSLERRFSAGLEALGRIRDGDTLWVALSGGVDSVVLLHLLRFGAPRTNVHVRAAHFDHGMREGSAADAEWVKGLCRSWAVPLHQERAATAPGSESEARTLRYDFLRRTLGIGPGWILTAHHRDDQIETVLFRTLRGTGIPGLRGIPAVRDPDLLRPLLPFSKKELVEYADRRSLPRREDPTNREDEFARNRLRNTLLPWIRRELSPGVDRAMLGLARAAERNERAWRNVLESLTERLVREKSDGRIVFARPELRGYDSAALEQMLFYWARSLGIRLRERSCRAGVRFMRTGTSGSEIRIERRLVLRREFDRLVLERTTDEPGPEAGLAGKPPSPRERDELTLRSAQPGRGRISIGGRTFEAVWGLPGPPVADWKEAFDATELAFPLTLRGWSFGDRIEMSYGTKKVKKLFNERRVRSPDRGKLCILVDGEGRLLWIPGLVRSRLAPPTPGRTVFRIGVSADRTGRTEG